MWDLSSLTRDRTHTPCIGGAESQSLDPQEVLFYLPLKGWPWELGCKLKTTGCEPEFLETWRSEWPSFCPYGWGFTRTECSTLDSEASRKVCWEEEEWRRSIRNRTNSVRGDTREGSHWLPLTVLLWPTWLADWLVLPVEKAFIQ